MTIRADGPLPYGKQACIARHKARGFEMGSKAFALGHDTSGIFSDIITHPAPSVNEKSKKSIDFFLRLC